MCGIAGYVAPGGIPDPEQVEAMIATLAHRGPDEGGVAIVGGADGLGPVCVLGHRRLRVIDLSAAARQPMSNEDGTVHVTFNGEIYNFRELRSELRDRGHTFRSASDTEVIVHAYEEHGDDLVEHLDGMFAFALWDGRAGRLLLARDRLGKKPMHYALDRGHLRFGSEIKALRAAPGFDAAVDLQRVPEVLAFGGVPWPRTMFEGIKQVPPGCIVTWDATTGLTEPTSYWHPHLSSGDEEPVSWDEAVDMTRALMRRAVERRLAADVPLGVLLSGGLDSSVIVALMASLGVEIRTFTASVRGDGYDERGYARLVADRFGTLHTEIEIDSTASDLLDLVLRYTDEPFADSSALPTYLIAKAAREHVTVVLTGDGGDEVFAGYDRFRAALLAAAAPTHVQRLVAAVPRAMPASPGYFALRSRADRFMGHPEVAPELRYRDWVGIFDETALRGLLSPEFAVELPGIAFTSFDAALEEAPPQPLLHRLMAANLRTYLPDDLLVKTDRMTMASSLEARSPFLDTALLEYVGSLPSSYKATITRSKRLLKAAAHGLVPTEIRRRRKHGFGVPVGAWFKSELADPFQDLVLAPDARCNQVLDPSAVASLFRAHRAGSADHGQQLWSLLALESFLRSAAEPLPTA